MVRIPQRLLGEALQISSGINPEKTAIIFKGQEYSYKELNSETRKLAAYLTSIGIRKGDRVAIYMNNSWHCVLAIYAITLAGGVFLIINPQTKADKLHYILTDSGARTLFAESILHNELALALKDFGGIDELILSGPEVTLPFQPDFRLQRFENIMQSDEDNPEVFPRIIPNDLAALIYTSGSTGFPKGVMMTHQNMVFTSWSLIEYLRLSEKDRILLLLPMAFDYGLYQLFMAITSGGTLIIEQSFAFPATIYKQIETLKPTVFPGVPTIYAMMIATSKKKELSFDCIEKVTNTAAKLPGEFLPELQKIFPKALIFKMYGLTECKRVCYLEPEFLELKPESVGKAIPGTEVFLMSPEGEIVPPGGTGILHIRGPHVMAGYWNKEELTNQMLKPGFIPGERILCSQDWFRMDKEGFLYFQGRTDDIIKTRGEKVSPVEIENLIYQLKGIREVAVFGMPDEVLGESIAAVITVHETASLTDKEILMHCSKHLEMFMVPQKILFLQEMPKSSNGKIDKKILKQMLS
ncbi:MAG: acyl--CoA ligase [Bacteroidales bacterium]|nr:acyl--CoA ligase [Bacteroidales bacterium]